MLCVGIFYYCTTTVRHHVHPRPRIDSSPCRLVIIKQYLPIYIGICKYGVLYQQYMPPSLLHRQIMYGAVPVSLHQYRPGSRCSLRYTAAQGYRRVRFQCTKASRVSQRSLAQSALTNPGLLLHSEHGEQQLPVAESLLHSSTSSLRPLSVSVR